MTGKLGSGLDASRKALPALVRWLSGRGVAIGEALHARASAELERAYRVVYRFHGPSGVFARTWNTGAVAFWAVLGLFGFLLLYLWGR